MKIFTYKLTNDSGCAPNPHFGFCSLAICKPQIREQADVGDIIIGFGSRTLGSQNKIIYIMRVTNKMSYQEYFEFCQEHYPKKISHGDCIYHKIDDEYVQIANIHHNTDCISHDLKSEYVLISNDFRYFGKKAIDVPDELASIIPECRNYKSKSNRDYRFEVKSFFNMNKRKYKKELVGKAHSYVSRC